MKIISKFKDYYDGPASWGEPDPRDERFVRINGSDCLEYDTPPPPWYSEFELKLTNSWPERPDSFQLGKKTSRKIEPAVGNYTNFRDDLQATVTLVLFCGRIYPTIRIRKRGWEAKSIYFSTVDSFVRFLTKHGGEKQFLGEFENPRYFRPYGGGSVPKSPKEEWERFFDGIKGGKCGDAPHKYHNTPIIAIHFPEVGYHRHGRVELEVSPILSNMGFPFYVDAVTAAQELDMYLHAVLATQPEEPAQISDASLAASKGYDKWSFRRNSADSKKPRRKGKKK